MSLSEQKMTFDHAQCRVQAIIRRCTGKMADANTEMVEAMTVLLGQPAFLALKDEPGMANRLNAMFEAEMAEFDKIAPKS